MKNILFTILALTTFLPVESQTQFKLNQYNIVHNQRFMPVFTMFGGHQITSKAGIAGYFYVNGMEGSSWGEGLAGPLWSPVKGLTIGFLAGFQTNEDQLFRYSPILLYNYKQFSGFASFEVGGERHRWDIMAFYLMDDFKFGGEMIRFYQMYAAGPRIEFSFFKKQPVTLFYSGLWDWTNDMYASMFGIYTTFSEKK
jgi:hypothetical protein